MTTAKELLVTLATIMGHARSWEKEVRFNWVRQFGRNLVFFANPENVLEFERAAGAEFLMPKGIIAITRTLLHQQLSDEAKIADIKTTLLRKGYDGEHEGSSWKRTAHTHEVYKQLAKAIAAYELELEQSLGASVSCIP